MSVQRMLENETEENVLEWKRMLKFIIISSNFRSCHTFGTMMGSLSFSSSMTMWGSCEYALLKLMSAFCTLIPPNENNTYTTYKHTHPCTHTHTRKYIHVYTYNWYSQCTTALFIVMCWCCSHHKWIDLYGSAHKMTQFIYAMGFCFNLIASIFIFSLLWMGYTPLRCEYDVSHCPPSTLSNTYTCAVGQPSRMHANNVRQWDAVWTNEFNFSI